MLKYVLEANVFAKKEADDLFHARPVDVRTRTEKDLAKAIEECNLGISRSEYLAVREAEARIIETWLADGDSFTSDTVQIHHTIPGTFKPDEHPTEAIVKITAGKRFRAAAKKTVLEKTTAHDQLFITFVENKETGQFNETVTEYGTFKIAGHNLKIAGTDPSVGIEFHSLEDPESIYKVESRHITINNPSELVFTAPWMASGEEVEVRVTTQFIAGGGKKPLNKPRSVTFDKPLTVFANEFIQKPKQDASSDL